MAKILYVIAIVALIQLIISLLRVLLHLQKEIKSTAPSSIKDGVEYVKLEDLARSTWLKDETPEQPEKVEPIVRIEGPALAPFEKEGFATSDAPTESDSEAEVTFNHAEIKKFYDEYVKSAPSGYQRMLLEVLNILDDEGDLPSVHKIPKGNDPDNELPKSQFDVYAQVPLWRHSLNTAEEMIKEAEDKKKGSNGPMFYCLLIACLGHDLGKAKKYLAKYYVTGEHMNAGANVVDQLAFSILNETEREQIVTAIKTHHYKTVKGLSFMSAKVIAADKNARKRELREANFLKVTSTVEPVVEEATADERSRYDTSDINIPWFNEQEYLGKLKEYINYSKPSRKFYAFTMPDGRVYFYGKILYEAFHGIATERQWPEMSLYQDPNEQQRLLIYLVNRLRKGHLIATDLIKEGFFVAPFLVQMQGEETPRRFAYTPFNASAFGIRTDDEEATKQGFLRRIESVVPDYGKKERDLGKESSVGNSIPLA